MRFGAPQKATYNAEEDTFPVQYLLAPCAVLGVLINQDHTSPFEMIWAFSIYLEAVAILPQLFLLQKQGEVRLLPETRARAVALLRKAPRSDRLVFIGGESHISLRVRSRLVSGPLSP
eukprot:scaffold216223_cov40-Tisochrysis_lutea.AAC.2